MGKQSLGNSPLEIRADSGSPEISSGVLVSLLLDIRKAEKIPPTNDYSH